MKLALYLILATQISFALDRLPLPGDESVSPVSALERLQIIASDSRYIACKTALGIFKESLTLADEAALKRHQSNLNVNDLKNFVDAKRKQLAKIKISEKIDIRRFKDGVEFSVSYNKQKCQFSILPQLEENWIKATIHPEFSNLVFKDAKAKEFVVSAEQLGAVTSEKKSEAIVFDPSKIFTRLEKMGITQIRDRDWVFEQFQSWEQKGSSAPSKEVKESPPK